MNKPNGYVSIETEWRFLAGLLDSKNTEWVNRATVEVFTGTRRDVFSSMQKAYQQYGVLSYEGVQRYLQRDIPGELLAVHGVVMDAAADELVGDSL